MKRTARYIFLLSVACLGVDAWLIVWLMLDSNWVYIPITTYFMCLASVGVFLTIKDF